MKHITQIVLFLIILSIGISFSLVYIPKYKIDKPKNTIKKDKKENVKTFTITATGDSTIGWDTNFGYGNRFDTVFKNNGKDYGYFYKNVKEIFESDDLTYVNFEGTFTNETTKVEKRFNFKSSPDFVNVLKEGSVEIVGLANNHSYDYGQAGYEETMKTLKENNIDFFGREYYVIKEVNGIKVGFFGLIDIDARKYNDVDKAIKYLKENNCDLIIAALHWGIEGSYNQTNAQVKLGHYMIDNGVDLVIGSHPHVIQGIEKYKDRYIIYSLGNFCFGGNPNPKDKDTFIFQQTFKFINNELVIDDNIKIIPASISSTSKNNNYQPTPLSGDKKNKVLNKIIKNSNNVKF